MRLNGLEPFLQAVSIVLNPSPNTDQDAGPSTQMDS